MQPSSSYQSQDSHMMPIPCSFHSLLRPSFSVPSCLNDSPNSTRRNKQMSLSSLKAILYDELGVSLVRHTHTYIHTYMHTYIHTYIHTCIYTYIHTYMHAYIYNVIHTHTYTYIHTHVRTYIHTYASKPIHTYTHTHNHGTRNSLA